MEEEEEVVEKAEEEEIREREEEVEVYLGDRH